MKSPVELLSLLERPLRVSIWNSVRAIDDRLDDIIDDAPASLAPCFNMVALLELHFGRSERARRLCEDQMAWLKRLGPHAGADAQLIFQPWVNLARLDRAAGDVCQAEARLDAMLSPESIAAMMGKAALSALPEDQRQDPKRDRFIIAVWTCEQLLIAVRCRRFQTIDRVAHILGEAPPDELRMALLEARMMAECLPQGPMAGDVDSAAFPTNASELQLHSLVLRRYALEGRRCPASRAGAATQIERLVSGHLGREQIEPWRLALVQHAVALLAEWTNAAALPLADAAYDASIGVGDEVLTGWFARAGVDLSAGAAPWIERYEAARRQSWYAGLRHEDSPAIAIGARHLDRLTERLRAMVARAAAS